MVQRFGLLVPGQIISRRLNVESIREDEPARDITERQRSIAEGILGYDLAKRVQAATTDKLAEDTLTGQLVDYVDTMAFIYALMYSSSGKPGDAPLIQKLKDRNKASLVLSGDSCGNEVIAYFPNPTLSLQQNLAMYGMGLSGMLERGRAVEKMPHPKEGGLAIAKIDLESAVRMCEAVNVQLRNNSMSYGSQPQAKVTKTNSPNVHAISASEEALNLIKQSIIEQTGSAKNFIYLTTHRFHDPDFMRDAAREWGISMGPVWVPRPYFSVVSNMDGDLKHFGRTVKRDMVASVMSNINLNTGRDKSVAHTLQKLGVAYAIIFNFELAVALKGTDIKPVQITDLKSLMGAREQIYSLIDSSQAVRAQASPSLQPSRSTPYLAQR